MAGIDKLLHPVFAVDNGGLDKHFRKFKIQPVGGGQKNNCGMAFAALFVNSVLNADIAVAESVDLQTAAAEIEIRNAFVG